LQRGNLRAEMVRVMATRKRAPGVNEQAFQQIMAALEEMRAEQRTYYESLKAQLEGVERRLSERIDRCASSIASARDPVLVPKPDKTLN